MSTVLFLTPVIIGSWPAIKAAVMGAAAVLAGSARKREPAAAGAAAPEEVPAASIPGM